MGSLFESLPLAVIGCNYRAINLLSINKNIPWYIQFILLSFIFLLFQYDIFIVPQGFRYPSIFLNALASSIFLLLFNSLLIDKIFIITIITRNITKFTGGIYYIHITVRDYLENRLLFFKKRTYLSALVIYIICYFICFVGSKYFKYNKLKYLFL